MGLSNEVNKMIEDAEGCLEPDPDGYFFVTVRQGKDLHPIRFRTAKEAVAFWCGNVISGQVFIGGC